MNRRDYLVGMGAAAALATLPSYDVLGNSAIPKCFGIGGHESAEPATPTSLLRWVPTSTPPSRDAFVTAIFWGLIGFCYKTSAGPPFFDVGFHAGNNHHELKVTIVEIHGSTATEICSVARPNITSMALKVVGQGQPPKVFQASTPFDRETGHDQDFRWMPDLDSLDFYPEPYPKKKHFAARLNLSHGVLYTRTRTLSKFKLVRAENHLAELRPFGHVAWIMAAAMEVQNNTDFVSFEANGQDPCLLKQKAGVRYQIIFKNESSHSCPGPSTINDPDEKKRNDFHFTRKLLKLPGDRIKYSLKIDHRVSPGAQLDFYNPEKQVAISDEAPCMGAGYGQTDGFPR